MNDQFVIINNLSISKELANFVGKELLSPRLESKLQDDAESRRLIKRTNRLKFV